MSRFSVKYKVREGDTYENLLQRFGSTLANAGIYGDEDLVNNKEFNLGVNTREEAELLLRKDLEYQRNINEGIRLKNAKNFDDFWALNGQDILIRYGYDRGKDKQYAEDLKESLRLRYIQGENSVEKLIAGANKKELNFWDGTYANQKRLEQLLKILHNAREIQKQGDSLRYVKGNSLSNPGSFQFGYSADLYNLNEPLTNVKYLELVEQELGRKLTDLERQHLGLHAEDYLNFLKLGKGKTYLDYLNYLEGEHRSAESTRNLTRDIATGITLGAAGLGSAAASSGIGLVPNAVKNVTSKIANFGLRQVPWMAGSTAANAGLDAIAGDDLDSWANNRYVRGAANAIGMAGGNFAGGLIKGASKYGLKYIPRAAGALTQNAIGSFGNTLGSMEGMAAMDHLAEGMDILNPYGRAAISTAGMFLGHNANRKLMQKAKEKIGKSINNKLTLAFNESVAGNDAKASLLLNEEQQLLKVLNNSLVSKALDVKGSNTMPTLFSAVEHMPVLGAMEAAAFAEDLLGTDILHNPIVQSAMILGAGKARNKISDIAYKTKKLSGGKGDLAGVVENVMGKKGDFTGTYGTNMVGNGVLKKWFPGMSKELITDDMVNRKLLSLSPEEKADFIGKGDVGGMRARAKQSGFDASKGEKGYIEAEHNKGRNPMFTSGGFAHLGIGLTLPEGFTPKQFYTAVAAKTAGSRHGFGYKYGTMIPKITEKGDFTKAEFVDSKGNSQPVLRRIGNRYVFNPEFKADAGFRGQDTYMGIKNGNALWSNVAGHVGTLVRIPEANGKLAIMKIGIDTPGYGDTAKRYKGASQALGTILGKGLDYFTPRPQYTVWGEYVNPNGNIFSNTTNVQTGNNSSKVNMRSTPNYMTPTGMIPTLHQTPATLRDHLKFRQLQKAELSKTPEQQAIRSNASVLETMGRYNYADRYNKAWGTNFREGDQKYVFEKVKDINHLRPDNAMINPNYYESTLGFMREHNLGLPRTTPKNNNQKSFYLKLNDEYAAYRALKEGY